jgi:diguanylate cyclase (GGDEF)-like protein/PAS domain S-box-containing protein
MVDISTLFIVVLLISVLLGGALATVAVGTQRDLRLWAAGMGLQALGYALMLARPLMPEWLSVVGANVALSSSIALYAEGLCRFQARPADRRLIWSPVLLFLLSFPWLLDDYSSRFLLSSALYLGQGLVLGKLLLEGLPATPGRGQYLILAGVVLWAGLQVVRLAAQLTGIGASQSLFESTPIHAATFLSSLSSTLLLALGVVIMMRERAESVLVASERHYRRLIEQAEEGIAVIEQQRLRYVNPCLCRLTGRDAAALVDQPFVELIDPEDRDRTLTAHRQRLQGLAENRAYDIRLLQPDGGSRWVRVTGVRFDWQGRPATLAFVTDITEARKEQSEIRDLAFQDALTGLANRRSLQARLDQAQTEATAQGKYGALLFLDLDNFKPLNDAHGHAAGDLLLREVARRLRAAVRQLDVVARFGGDEFVLLVIGLAPEPARATDEARALAESLRAVLAEPYRLDGGPAGPIEHHCTASIGVALFGPGIAADSDPIERADQAMYAAKQQGRNRVGVAVDELLSPRGTDTF